MIKKESYEGINYCLRCGEKLLLSYDREDKLRPQCQRCGWVFYKNPIPAVACVVVNEENQLLLVKRRFDPQSGFWALPSGYMEIWQTPEQAAFDELQEETGLFGEIDFFIGYYSGFSPIYERVLSLGFKMKNIKGKLQAGDDAEDARYFDIDNLPEIAFWSHQDFLKKLNILK
ncbi:MAG: NUDIX hydrolase [Candidatus Cloacimonetes bacterium]|jgi:ADP-ribose pyrophosphatase YjhB (NUDIX family)|nr:NUDIX hydrolase [Candidatus Cloacimonadota bacterium]MDD4155291.1 NUDIX hydrolase [Candidatus Cloacimonadota bacterium]